MKNKFKLFIISILAISLMAACGMGNNDKNEDRDEAPLEQNDDDLNREDNIEDDLNRDEDPNDDLDGDRNDDHLNENDAGVEDNMDDDLNRGNNP